MKSVEEMRKKALSSKLRPRASNIFTGTIKGSEETSRHT